jgi:hypothetical protein
MRRLCAFAIAAGIAGVGWGSARADQINTLTDFVREFDCILTFPMSTLSLESRNRPGAIMADIARTKVKDKTIYRILTPKFCVDEKTALPAATEGVDVSNFAQSTVANASLKLEIENILKILKLSAEFVDKVEVNISEVSLYSPQSKTIAKMVAAEESENFCAKSVIKPATSVVVTSACAGKVNIKFHYKVAVTAEIVEATIPELRLKLGATLNYTRETGTENKFVEVSAKKPVIFGINVEKTSEFIVPK